MNPWTLRIGETSARSRSVSRPSTSLSFNPNFGLKSFCLSDQVHRSSSQDSIQELALFPLQTFIRIFSTVLPVHEPGDPTYATCLSHFDSASSIGRTQHVVSRVLEFSHSFSTHCRLQIKPRNYPNQLQLGIMASGGVSPAPSMLGGIEGNSPIPPPVRTNLALSNLNPNSVPATEVPRRVKICVFCGASPGKSPGEHTHPSPS